MLIGLFFTLTLLLPAVGFGLLAERKGRRFWPWAVGGGVAASGGCLLLVALLTAGDR